MNRETCEQLTAEEIIEGYIRRRGICTAIDIVKALHMRPGTVDSTLYKLYISGIIKSRFTVYQDYKGGKDIGYYEYCHVIGPNHGRSFKTKFERDGA